MTVPLQSAPKVEPPLGPFATLPPDVAGLKKLKILLLVTSINSFSQRVFSYLQYLGLNQVSVQLATSDEDMLEAAESWQPDIVLCPFLTKKLPPSIHNKVSPSLSTSLTRPLHTVKISELSQRTVADVIRSI